MLTKVKADLLIIGMGAAAQMAALYAHEINPNLNILIVTKALKGKGGCSRMVQGGFNVVLNNEDSHEKHLMDTLKGGQYVNDQELAKTLVEQATPTIKELETKFGCFFDRNPNGTIHQKAFAGQSFDRTVHKGDLTGIEIISRLTEQVIKRRIPVLEECRAVELLLDETGQIVTGALLLNMRNGEFMVAEAAATLVATGGGPTHYRFHAPGPEKSVDGIAMLYRAGVLMKDLEMLQFHPTGLIVPGSVVAGALLEEGLRGSGAHLFNGNGERYMLKYAPEVGERATRDVVSRSSYLEMAAGRACPEGGVHIDAAHLGADFVLKNFPGMAERCSQFNYDLARGRVPVSPSAHFFMGGAVIDTGGKASLEKLFVAGEDAGGVHGANRLGGNGICESCVYGRQAGKALGKYLSNGNRTIKETKSGMAEEMIARLQTPFERTEGVDPFALRKEIQELNWNKVGVARNASDLADALTEIEDIANEVNKVSVRGGAAYNMMYNTFLDIRSMIDATRMIAFSAQLRNETRGAHFRKDFPDQLDKYGLFNIFLRRGDNGLPMAEKKPVVFSYKSLQECQQYRK
ncbi:L-aspartate oxidase [Desulfomonile tiedjei]|uniref:Aspartate oxidase n=1 Tax=Desulfomonile tiedjei (strain ATCC 49306 / DSM 6799 / DCB-1) TaxID=706587 RepID=I4C4V4_DESTA|nr:FAD-binding protein [Desulfomonile tiedjei]AFM24595.1 aspartate oxidase [Desulfomonile tiedjei DSM 6799]